MKNRIDWIKKIHPNFKEEKWFHDKVISPNEIELFEFYEEDCSYEDYINPNKIIGISYAFEYNSFSDITWIELLNSLKRLDRVIDNFKTYDDVKNHIHYNKEYKYVSKYGDYFITTAGQHRLCLSKFLNLEKVKTKIVEHKLNNSRLKFYNILKENIEFFKSLGFYYETDKELIEYTKNNNYLFIYFDNFKLRINSKILEYFIEYYKNLKSNFFNTKYAKFKRTLELNNWINVDSIDELKKYKHIILKEKL